MGEKFLRSFSAPKEMVYQGLVGVGGWSALTAAVFVQTSFVVTRFVENASLTCGRSVNGTERILLPWRIINDFGQSGVKLILKVCLGEMEYSPLHLL